MSRGSFSARRATLAAFLLWTVSGAAAAAPATAVEVGVLARPVARGDLVSEADFVFEETTPARARSAVPPERAAGREARRDLAAGAVVRATDLVAPRLVRRGEPVTITVRRGGLAIGSPGRALSNGGRGDLVRVVSEATGRTLDGYVEGPSAVRIVAP